MGHVTVITGRQGRQRVRTGHWAEAVACAYLERRGLVLLQRNYRCRFGELDLVMRDGDTLVFAEVRYRANPVAAAESIDPVKQRRLRMAGADYLGRTQLSATVPCRFDVILVSGSCAVPRCAWLKSAFECDA